MTQDLNLLRGIMLFAEEQPVATAFHLSNLKERFPEADELVIADHVIQLKEEGLIQGFAEIYPREKMAKIRIERITSPGHDFIRALKDDSVWSKTKKEVIDQGKAASIGMIVEYAKALAAEHLGLS
jgi:hypothetical protein